MTIALNNVEARILGALVEKSFTTPEIYPLSLNALLNACNQKTSREPVMSLDEAAVGQGLHSLLQKELARRVHEPGSRVPKFSHRVENLLTLGNAQEVGAICVLLLRGPQTPGEIKTRTERLCQFNGTAEVESLLQDLAARAVVAKLPRQPGQKESRYQHLFSGAVAGAETVASIAPAAPAAKPSVAPDRVVQLEKRVETLEARLNALEQRLNQPV